MTETHIKLDAAIVAAMIKAREVGVKMLASDCEQILSAAGIDGQFMDCGHHKSLLLTSAETGEPLYCEYCDMRDQRNDLLASAPEVGEAVDMDENTAKRFRGILSLLGISAPESDESLILCQFPLLGMMRHKIQQIYDQPDRTAQLEQQLGDMENLYNETMLERDIAALYSQNLEARIAELEAKVAEGKRLLMEEMQRATERSPARRNRR